MLTNGNGCVLKVRHPISCSSSGVAGTVAAAPPPPLPTTVICRYSWRPASATSLRAGELGVWSGLGGDEYAPRGSGAAPALPPARQRAAACCRPARTHAPLHACLRQQPQHETCHHHAGPVPLPLHPAWRTGPTACEPVHMPGHVPRNPRPMCVYVPPAFAVTQTSAVQRLTAWGACPAAPAASVPWGWPPAGGCPRAAHRTWLLRCRATPLARCLVAPGATCGADEASAFSVFASLHPGRSERRE